MSAARPDSDWEGMTQLEIGVALMAHEGPKAHQVWLPPLDTPDTLDGLIPDLAVDPNLGLTSAQWRSAGLLTVPLGTVDLPLEQRRQPLVFDLSGAGGNLVVIGSPLSGKSTFLRTLVMALSLIMTPLEAQFYIVDFGGGTFTQFTDAVHVAAVATRDQAAVMARIVAEIEDLMDRREVFFRERRIDSMMTYRMRRARGEADDGHGDIFLVVDGWATLRSDFEQIETRIQTIAARGLGLGVHVIVASGRWMDLRQPLRDVLGSKFELRLGDPSDSAIDRKAATVVPENRPGRGIDPDKHHTLVALPRIDSDHRVETLSDGVTDALTRIAQAWRGPAAPKLQQLPTRIGLDQLLAMNPSESRIILGLEERHLSVLTLDPSVENHLLVFGDAQTGKTTVLRSLVREIARTSTPATSQIYVIDLRRTLLGEIPEEFLCAYLATREDVADMISGLAGFLQGRLPGRDVTPEQLRTRSWWRGPEAWVIIDDYDLVSTQSGNPAGALQPLLTQAHDVGFHLVISRRSGGIARQLYDSLIQGMSEMGTTGIILSGSPDEGPVLSGVRFRKSNPGRAQVVTRDQGAMTAQLAWSDPTV